MANMLDILMRKQSTQHLDSRHQTLVEEAYFTCKPPERSVVHRKERSPLQFYIRKLLFLDLNKRNVEKILDQLRKMPWNHVETRNYLIKCFCKPWCIKYGFIRYMADILSGLMRYYNEFGVIVVDNILELIHVDLEVYNFRRHQKQVAVIKYLGELYNYEIVDDQVIFNTLYTLITFGHEQGHAMPHLPCPIDPLEDCFRIKLVCTLLEACSDYFDHGILEKKLDIFLIYFQVKKKKKN
jgi:regulator of nonsense transcripts 2